MSEHHAAVTVHAPVHQVYTLFTHFNDFPKFMSFVKEVTYLDDQRSHWVAQIAGQHEWDAINEDWMPDRQVGWRSINGLENTGKVKFMASGPEQTMVDVYLNYTPPAGKLGALIDSMGVDSSFDDRLQQDLNHFAHMVEQAPPGVLDPMQSSFLFNEDSAVSTGNSTDRQNASMARDPMMSGEAMEQRQATIDRDNAHAELVAQQQRVTTQHQADTMQESANQQQAALNRQAEVDHQNALQQQQMAQQQATAEQERLAQRDPTQDIIGGRNPTQPNTALGDLDARTVRHPAYEQEAMLARDPEHAQGDGQASLQETQNESPWQQSIRGNNQEPPHPPTSNP